MSTTLTLSQFLKDASQSFDGENRPTVAEIRRFVLNRIDYLALVELVSDVPDLLTWKPKSVPSEPTPASVLRAVLTDLVKERLDLERTGK